MGIQDLRSLHSPRRNFARNPSFDLWQAGTTFASQTYNADCWKSTSTLAARTISRQAGFSGARYCARVARDSGSSTAGNTFIAQVCSSELAYQLAGKQIIISADIRIGANFSGAGVNATVITGTGIDEVLTASGVTPSFPTGSVSSGAISPNVAATTTAQRLTWGPYTVPAGITELGFRITFVPSGTSGAADYFEVTNVKLEIGSRATAFEFEPLAITLASALRLYRKSFLDATTPAQNAGAGTGERRAVATVAGANLNSLGSVSWAHWPMRAAPAITFYNPAAANGQVRDITAGADCSAAAAANISDKGFEITCTGNAATAVGNRLGVHFIADSRAF
jgi:hypothetical protein